MVNWKAQARKWLWFNASDNLKFFLKVPRKATSISVSIADDTTEI